MTCCSYTLLLRLSAEALMEFAPDPRQLGAEIGFFSVLHTWNQKLEHYSLCWSKSLFSAPS